MSLSDSASSQFIIHDEQNRLPNSIRIINEVEIDYCRMYQRNVQFMCDEMDEWRGRRGVSPRTQPMFSFSLSRHAHHTGDFN